MSVPRSATTRFAVIAARVVLVAEALMSLWIALAMWMFQLSSLDDDGSTYDRYGTAIGPVLALVWAGVCVWAVTSSVRHRRSGARRPAIPVAITAAAHLLGTVWAAAHGLWPTAVCSLAVAVLLAAAARPARPARPLPAG
ncbi:hypothetical protein [Kitasatospora sp. NPDC093558]|uniref:hypothetical protein n=1 Tax=Kitasatospora sp. NPDC093558 TaxID=3155201 RepID=UPI003425AAF6